MSGSSENGAKPVFHSLRDLSHQLILNTHPSIEVLAALNAWAGYCNFGNLSYAIHYLYISNNLDDNVLGAFNSKALVPIKGPEIVIIEAENIDRVQFSAWNRSTAAS